MPTLRRRPVPINPSTAIVAPFRDLHDIRRHLADAESWLLLARAVTARRAVRLRAAAEAQARAQVVIGIAAEIGGGAFKVGIAELARAAGALLDEADAWTGILSPQSAPVVIGLAWLDRVPVGMVGALAANEAA